MTDPQSLTNPSTYLHAALRAFVSSAYERVDKLLTLDVFNYGKNARYPDIQSLLDGLREGVDYWQNRNVFIADLINRTLSFKPSSEESDEDLALRIFRELTNYFFCYIKVDHVKRVSTVRVLFPVDSDCTECPLEPLGREKCGNSCFRFSFFPYKETDLLDAKYIGHYNAAQFALADATYAAGTPDLSSGDASDVPLAALMVPLLFGQPLLLTDAAAFTEEYRLSAQGRVLMVRRRFPNMNHDLGIRSEAFIPIPVSRSLMPGFYAGVSSTPDTRSRAKQEWVPRFEKSCPFCIELYSPMPDWFKHADDGKSAPLPGPAPYVFQQTKSDPRQPSNPPIPEIFSSRYGAEKERVKASRDDLAKVLALGFNLQHYSELMADGFVHWLRQVFTDKAYDPLAPTLRRRYREFLGLKPSESLPPDVEQFLRFVKDTPDLLVDVLNEIQHGMLLQPNLAPSETYDLTSLDGIKQLARKVDGAISVAPLPYGQVPYCDEPLSFEELPDILRACDRLVVLPRLVAEVLKNHRREGQKEPIGFHTCVDPDQHRFSLHFSSPRVKVDLRSYLNLRQGLPQRTASPGRGGIGLAISRVIAEEQGFEYVLGLGRDEEFTPAKQTFDVSDYRRDLHTRLYFGDPL